MSNKVHAFPKNWTHSVQEHGQPKMATTSGGAGANPRKKEESFTYSTEQRHVEKNSGELRNPKSWTALSTSLFGRLPLLWASHVVRSLHLDPGNSNEAPTVNTEVKINLEENMTREGENGDETGNRDWDARKWGQGKKCQDNRP